MAFSHTIRPAPLIIAEGLEPQTMAFWMPLLLELKNKVSVALVLSERV